MYGKCLELYNSIKEKSIIAYAILVIMFISHCTQMKSGQHVHKTIGFVMNVLCCCFFLIYS